MAKIIQQKIICKIGASYAVEKIVVEKIAINEATAEILNAIKDKIQKNIANIPTLKSKAIRQPMVVAIPLPPLKFR